MYLINSRFQDLPVSFCSSRFQDFAIIFVFQNFKILPQFFGFQYFKIQYFATINLYFKFKLQYLNISRFCDRLISLQNFKVSSCSISQDIFVLKYKLHCNLDALLATHRGFRVAILFFRRLAKNQGAITLALATARALP